MTNKFAEPWKIYMQNYDKYYWQPGKPTEDEKRIFYRLYKNALEQSNSEKKKALVLGCTPALRDELAKLDVEVTCLDLDRGIFDVMSTLISHDKKENFMKGDWTSIPFENNGFDIVTGDLAQGNIMYKNKQKFFSEVKRVLKPTGRFIHRIFVFPDKWAFKTAEDVFEEFIKLDDSCDRSTELLCYFFYTANDSSSNEVDTQRIKEMIKPYWKDGKYHHGNPKIELLLNRMYKMYGPFEKVWCTAKKDVVFSWISEYFDIVEEIHANDHIMATTFFFVDCKPNI
ncbi:MAG: methyltransferase domain-containing protein [archaeon]